MNLSVEMDLNALKSFKDDLKSIKGAIDSQELNMHRAKKYRDYTVDVVKNGRLNIKNISSATQQIDMRNHDPESLTGKLMDAMKVRPSGKNGAEAGYFENSMIVPNQRGRKKDLTFTDLAILQHTGYRIPLQGDKGADVRRFLAYHKIFVKKDKAWMVVPPRPFMHRALGQYEREDLDNKAVKEFIDKKLGK